MKDMQRQDRRIRVIVSEESAARDTALQRWYKHLMSHLVLPCDVTGIEDLQWEEFYAVGPGSAEEYEALRKEQPSYEDVFDLISLDPEADSEWSMFHEDLKAHVCRKSDGKSFVLGLSELKTVDKRSGSHQLLDDYSVWFVNSR
jgi:hypothetical protein